MNVIEALKTGRPMRRCATDRWIMVNPHEYLNIPREWLIADDWEVQPEIIEISREEYFAAIRDWANEVYSRTTFYGDKRDFVELILSGTVAVWEQLKKQGKLK